MSLARIIVSLDATESGDIVVGTTVEGDLQYLTGIGMLEMAKESLADALEEQED